jgi:hypothetical protein
MEKKEFTTNSNSNSNTNSILNSEIKSNTKVKNLNRSIIKNQNNFLSEKKMLGLGLGSTLSNNKISLKSEEMKSSPISIYSNSKKGETIKKKQGQSIKDKSELDSFEANLLNKAGLNQILEMVNKESKIFSTIDESIDYFNGEKFLTGKEKEKGKYEMIEKNIYIKMKENNFNLKQKIEKLIEDNNTLIEKMNLTSSEIKKLKLNYDKKEKEQNDKRNDLYNQGNEIKELNVFNEKLHEMILDNRMKRHNIIKALEHVTKKYKNIIPKDKRKLFENYSSDNLMDFISENNSEKIENLKLKIKNLELELKLRDKDMENLKQSIHFDPNNTNKPKNL